MKNLKKVLALVLVFASLFGLATMASATKSDDYSDAASISHVEAVDVMSTIGVFDGISGAFSGDSILTREQAAKIITYMILGKDDADALVASVAPYTDVARDRWSAGSIAYCKNQGILAGVGNGRFEPNGKLTGVAFAKMCLVALGYDPAVESLTGPDWAVNTSKLAIASAGITANLSQVSLADEMSREDACQMAFNTLQANMVDYDSRGTNISVNGATISMSASKAKPVSAATGWTDAEDRDGHIYQNLSTGQVAGTMLRPGQDGIQQFAEKYFGNLKREDVKVDSFGRPSVTWTYKTEKIGTYVKNSWLVQSWTAKAPKNEMYNAIGGAVYDRLNATQPEAKLFAHVDGYNIESDVSVSTYFNKNSSAGAGTTIVANGDHSKIGKTGNGVKTELYMDTNGTRVWVAIINTYLVQATADYNTVTKRVNVEAKPFDDGTTDDEGNAGAKSAASKNFLPTSISGDDFDVSGVKEGDYLLLNISRTRPHESGNSTYTTIEEITEATVQTAAVTEYTEREDVTVGGTKYSYNQILGWDEKDESFAINSDATLVLDSYGYIMYVAEALNSSDFVYIDNFGSSSSLGTNALADAYFADGTNAEISVTKLNNQKNKSIISTYNTKNQVGQNIKSGNHAYTHWYTFSGASGGQYTLKTPDPKRYKRPISVITSSANAGSDLIKSGTVRFMNGVEPVDLMYAITEDTNFNPVEIIDRTELAKNPVKANDKTIFVIKDQDGDVTSYTGIASVPTVKLPDSGDNVHKGGAKVSWITRQDNDYASFVFVDVSNTGADVQDSNNVADYLFALKPTGNRTYVDGLNYLKYKVVIDGSQEERWILDTLVNGGDEGVLFKNIKEDSHGRITKGTPVGSKDKQSFTTMTMGKSHEITQKGNSLNVVADARLTPSGYAIGKDTTTKKYSDMYANSKSNINLVIKGSTTTRDKGLLSDEGASYETHLGVNASYVDGMLRDYYLSGQVYLVVTETDGDVIDTMWIYVTDVKKK